MLGRGDTRGMQRPLRTTLFLALLVVPASGLLDRRRPAVPPPSTAPRPSSQPQARQATLRGPLPTGLGLDAPAAAQESAMLCLIDESRERHTACPPSPNRRR